MNVFRWNRLLAAAIVGAACGESTNPNPQPQPNTTPASLAVASGDNQSATAGQPLPSPLTVVVRNSDNAALAGVTVDWTIVAGGGTLGSATSMTDAQGQAATTYTLDAIVGVKTVRASISGTSLTTDFTANAVAPMDNTPASITIVNGDAQSAVVGNQLSSALVVLVQNAGGLPLAGVDVDWAVASGGGVLGTAATATDGQGMAATTYTVGAAAGANSVIAEVRSNPALTVTFTATATAPPPTAGVNVADSFFDPMSATVAAGGTVTWTWIGNLGHNVTWVAGGFTDSQTQAAGSHMVTFPAAGTFNYYCTIHGTPTSGMRGSVVVP